MMREVQIEQYNNLCKKFEPGATPYALEEFLEMIDSMCRPFVCQIDGHEVSLTQDDCTIMMETLTMKVITESLFTGKDSKQKSQTKDPQQNKQQNRGNPMVRTECGTTGIMVLHQTSLQNSRQNKQASKQA